MEQWKFLDRGRVGQWIVLTLMVLILFGTLAVLAQSEGVTYTVQEGDTIVSIAQAHGVDPVLLQRVNRLLDDSRLVVGQPVIIPAPDAQPPADTYLVQVGDTLSLVAQSVGVDLVDLMAANGLTDPNLVEVGQVLVIPAPAPTPTITPMPTLTPTPLPGPVALPADVQPFIQIVEPSGDAPLRTPFTLIAFAPGGDGRLTVRILDATGHEIGGGVVEATADQPAPAGYTPFLGVITFTVPLNSQTGRIQVSTTSPRDGAMEQLNSRTVTLQGLDLDATIRAVGDALAAGDAVPVRAIMAKNSFRLGDIPPRGRLLGSGIAVTLINRLLTESAASDTQISLDLSVDGAALLPEYALGKDLLWVAVTRGWADDQIGLLTFRRSGDTVVWDGLILVAGE
ncbi:MAG: LysM peptidoglycan-binding domain-containing protein [Caldilineaceae bacterium]|nr:LysM peptidoglycan-binding domain-containing protein [Caldilineaceae bacterium]MBP8110083.1 LysM peptidoglycan-binding domain-containing protein [Caldilineaceae bacterium]MBP8123753.1 LysM peptidoglycan-binding domain-containing protein [Caldilineaceae bacterium]MBP9074589.1 LysM peptidoglycan-binding domain-containing protein [Caldilineaceae bacterium]